MAQTKEELQQQLDELAAKNAELQSKYEDLEKVAIDSGKIAIPIKGTFSVGKKKYGFQNGCKYVRDIGGNLIPTERLMDVANGGEAFTDEEIKQFPVIKEWDKAKAKEFLAWLVQIKYGLLRDA